ncbi:serine/threonine-protein kinase [Amycolatopsis azurea]|uniref:non-specific serine/threonine protein kinase n=1 Tax=Amycolatopsis azurea DSM 43854 TaxID=1238180 RepID=M2QM24_9PSEU|nr:serine/threonine-protein kinase [Amycolatopsis azurea]EMD26882.1 serine/threonine protein kinase [Amycolatopsis azurea DSM 43854]OOC06950.1 serine/threonine protein kinase [Amycolatopsis azurea DSM 43854]
MTDEQTRPYGPPQQTHQAAVGRIVAGRYALLGELGRGGMGIVWRAQDQVIGRQVAIKELKFPNAPEDASVLSERMLREVRSGGRLNDPAVVTVYDVVTENGATYIVMELVEAPTLADLVRERGPLPAQQVAQVGERVLSALRAAHAAGIVHRDVKPANIMVAPDGRVKLTDFGIAHAADDPRLTTSGMIVGSPAFMAPERVEGRDAMPESDLWSLGTTLFFAAEGIVAFERSTTAATLHAIMTEAPYLTRVQGPLAAAILGLLVTKPEARMSYDQVRSLLSAAQGVQAQPTPPSGGTAMMQPGQPMTRLAPAPAKRNLRPLWLSLAAVAVIGALVGGIFLGRWMAAPAGNTQAQATLTYGINGQVKLGSSGDCYNVPLREGINLNDGVSCDKDHLLEIFAKRALLDVESYSDDDAQIAEYPGVETVNRIAETVCAATFNSNVVPAAQRATLTWRAVVPTEAEWKRPPTEEARDYSRGFYCLLAKTDGGQIPSQITTKVK